MAVKRVRRKTRKAVRKNPLSRKYYTMVADALIDAYNGLPYPAQSNINTVALHKDIVVQLASRFQQDNSRFSYTRFKQYIEKGLKPNRR